MGIQSTETQGTGIQSTTRYILEDQKLSTKGKNLGAHLYKAAENKDIDRVIALLSDLDFTREDLEYKDGSQTPLYIAALRGDIDIVRAIVNAGAQLDVKCYNGYTALNAAVDDGYMNVVTFLYERGADPYIATHKGKNCFHTAKENNHMHILNYLRHQERIKKNNDPNEITFNELLNHYELEEIYQFNHLMRISVLRNKGDENFSFQRESFKDIQNQEGLQKAFNEHVKRGGIVPEQTVFPDRFIKQSLGHLKMSRK